MPSSSPPRRRSPHASPTLSHTEAVASLKSATASLPAPPPPPPRLASPAQKAPSGLPDPILRNALRYTISAREYSTLHKYLLSRSQVLSQSAPTPARVEQMVGSDTAERQKDRMQGKGLVDPNDAEDEAEENDYNARAVRHSMRVFVLTGLASKMWDMVMLKLGKKKESPSTKKQPLHKSPTLRLSVSLSTILLLYRLLFRFLTRLRGHLLDASAAPFRLRNPRVAAALTSQYAPAVGASFAGVMLGISPAKHMRVSMALYALFRALEFSWNLLEYEGMIWGFKTLTNGFKIKNDRPWWFGSWLTQPLVFGQLLNTLVFDRDCSPVAYTDWIMKQSMTYLQNRPEGYSFSLPWPSTYDVVDSLAGMAKLNWPTYVSPTLFPNKEVLPASLAAISPLTARAHPLIKSLSCATLHPNDPSCMRTYLTFWLQSFPPIAKTLFAVYSAMSLLPRFRTLTDAPMKLFTNIILRSLKLSTLITGSISSAWASICFFQSWFPGSFLARQRFFLGGFIAGLWSFIERKNGRSTFLSSARLSIDSLWKVGVKRRWWVGMRSGDVWLFVLALMISSVVYEKDARAVRENNWRKGISWVRGEGFQHWSYQLTEEEERKKEQEEESRRFG
ncbi:uncharacterized protein BROUX77_004016 [Berkeleyomyces rouxiae]|uniref:uncharacterized protein n=1 Tax=Berkeleyomyces rouxiae TaxID=2035830 RepID=UPI003B786FAB